jgi:hypothetical protein
VPEDGEVGISTGVYDVLSNGTLKTDCLAPYVMSLVVNSNLKSNLQTSTGRAEPNVLLITHADVRLMDKDQATLSFKAKDGTDDATRPNPYRVHTAASLAATTSDKPTTGIVQIAAIPSAYAEKLRGYADDSILVEIQLFGTTTGDVGVDFRPFVYPLHICSDCLALCKSDPMFTEAGSAEEFLSGQCEKSGPQDGRYCLSDCSK